MDLNSADLEMDMPAFEAAKRGRGILSRSLPVDGLDALEANDAGRQQETWRRRRRGGRLGRANSAAAASGAAGTTSDDASEGHHRSGELESDIDDDEESQYSPVEPAPLGQGDLGGTASEQEAMERVEDALSASARRIRSVLHDQAREADAESVLRSAAMRLGFDTRCATTTAAEMADTWKLLVFGEGETDREHFAVQTIKFMRLFFISLHRRLHEFRRKEDPQMMSSAQATLFVWPVVDMAEYEFGTGARQSQSQEGAEHVGDSGHNFSAEDRAHNLDHVVVITNMPIIPASEVRLLRDLLHNLMLLQLGTCVSVEIPTNAATNLTKGVAFVEMQDVFMAWQVARALDLFPCTPQQQMQARRFRFYAKCLEHQSGHVVGERMVSFCSVNDDDVRLRDQDNGSADDSADALDFLLDQDRQAKTDHAGEQDIGIAETVEAQDSGLYSNPQHDVEMLAVLGGDNDADELSARLRTENVDSDSDASSNDNSDDDSNKALSTGGRALDGSELSALWDSVTARAGTQQSRRQHRPEGETPWSRAAEEKSHDDGSGGATSDVHGCNADDEDTAAVLRGILLRQSLRRTAALSQHGSHGSSPPRSSHSSNHGDSSGDEAKLDEATHDANHNLSEGAGFLELETEFSQNSTRRRRKRTSTSAQFLPALRMSVQVLDRELTGQRRNVLPVHDADRLRTAERRLERCIQRGHVSGANRLERDVAEEHDSSFVLERVGADAPAHTLGNRSTTDTQRSPGPTSPNIDREGRDSPASAVRLVNRVLHVGDGGSNGSDSDRGSEMGPVYERSERSETRPLPLDMDRALEDGQSRVHSTDGVHVGVGGRDRGRDEMHELLWRRSLLLEKMRSMNLVRSARQLSAQGRALHRAELIRHLRHTNRLVQANEQLVERNAELRSLLQRHRRLHIEELQSESSPPRNVTDTVDATPLSSASSPPSPTRHRAPGDARYRRVRSPSRRSFREIAGVARSSTGDGAREDASDSKLWDDDSAQSLGSDGAAEQPWPQQLSVRKLDDLWALPRFIGSLNASHTSYPQAARLVADLDAALHQAREFKEEVKKRAAERIQELERERQALLAEQARREREEAEEGRRTTAASSSGTPSDVDTAETLCVVCQDAAKTVVLIPCRHLCVCGDCAEHEELSRCPICRSFIDNKIHVFA